MSAVLGCIADDFTGASDLANTLVRSGMRCVQTIGLPDGPLPDDAEAIVVALKSRTIEPGEAVRQSLEALQALRKAGCRQFFFKYCSTFDSTEQGNIGPVAEALLDALGAEITIACPAFPGNGRTVYNGHLFVGDRLLSESGMRSHPLTPMRDADLVRVLARQVRGGVGLLPYTVVAGGVEAVREGLRAHRAAGVRFAIADAIDDAHLHTLSEACADLPLLTGGSALAMGLPDNYRAAGLLGDSPAQASALEGVSGAAVALAGSCSQTTLAQVEAMRAGHESFHVDAMALADGVEAVVAAALAFTVPRLGSRAVLVYASASPDAVAAVQEALGRERAGALVEQAMAAIARGLVAAGARRLVVAGGETSGAVVEALGVRALRIGAQIDPGVPWTRSLGADPLLLALKSGNFGGVDFLSRAFEVAP